MYKILVLAALACLSAASLAQAQPVSPGVPTVSSCGTGPTILSTSTMNRGTVYTGTGSPTACTITIGAYALPLPTVPRCVVSASSAGTTPVVAAVTTRSSTAITVTVGSALTTGIIDYYCE